MMRRTIYCTHELLRCVRYAGGLDIDRYGTIWCGSWIVNPGAFFELEAKGLIVETVPRGYTRAYAVRG